MTTLQFPANPILNQEYDYPPYKYYWDGVKWKTKGIGYNPVNELRDELAEVDGAALVGGATYAQIRAYSGAATKIECKGISNTSHYGSGLFILDATDTVTPDDGGCVLVDANGGRWKRDLSGKGEVLVEWFGECIAGSDISIFVSNAIDFAIANSIPYVTLPITKKGAAPYVWVNNLTKDIGIADLIVRGSGLGHSMTKISHTNTSLGYALTLKRTSAGGTNIFAVGGAEHIWVDGNASSLGFLRLADSFGMVARKIFGTGYSLDTTDNKGSLITLANMTYWTEGATLTDIHSRDCYALLKFERTSAAGGTGSFFGLTMLRCWHRFSNSSSGAIFIKGASLADSVRVYGATIEIGGWFEAGADNALIRTADYGSIVESKVLCTPDGFGGNINGESVRCVVQGGLSTVDISLTVNGQQGLRFSLDGFANGTVVSSFAAAVAQYTASVDTGGWPIARLRARGARIVWESIPSTNKRIKIANIPPYSTARVAMSVIGSNKLINDEYLVTSFGLNEIASVTRLGGGATDTHFYCATYNDAAAKTVSTNNGCLFDLISNPTSAAGTGYKLVLSVTLQ